ncbi:MAG: hypothetical protein HRU38_07050 [Saccharospirillaceae bacterium]|nr:hypothetical protein [Saccharospirillaceae bacterium]
MATKYRFKWTDFDIFEVKKRLKNDMEVLQPSEILVDYVIFDQTLKMQLIGHDQSIEYVQLIKNVCNESYITKLRNMIRTMNRDDKKLTVNMRLSYKIQDKCNMISNITGEDASEIFDKSLEMYWLSLK